MRLLKVPEAAERLGLAPATVRKLIARRELPAVRPTRRAVRLREEDIAAFVRMGWRPRGTPEPPHPDEGGDSTGPAR